MADQLILAGCLIHRKFRITKSSFHLVAMLTLLRLSLFLASAAVCCRAAKHKHQLSTHRRNLLPSTHPILQPSSSSCNAGAFAAIDSVPLAQDGVPCRPTYLAPDDDVAVEPGGCPTACASESRIRMSVATPAWLTAELAFLNGQAHERLEEFAYYVAEEIDWLNEYAKNILENPPASASSDSASVEPPAPAPIVLRDLETAVNRVSGAADRTAASKCERRPAVPSKTDLYDILKTPSKLKDRQKMRKSPHKQAPASTNKALPIPAVTQPQQQQQHRRPEEQSTRLQTKAAQRAAMQKPLVPSPEKRTETEMRPSKRKVDGRVNLLSTLKAAQVEAEQRASRQTSPVTDVVTAAEALPEALRPQEDSVSMLTTKARGLKKVQKTFESSGKATGVPTTSGHFVVPEVAASAAAVGAAGTAPMQDYLEPINLDSPPKRDAVAAGSSPRKSTTNRSPRTSTNFASLPARQPFAKKSFGNITQLTRTSAFGPTVKTPASFRGVATPVASSCSIKPSTAAVAIKSEPLPTPRGTTSSILDASKFAHDPPQEPLSPDLKPERLSMALQRSVTSDKGPVTASEQVPALVEITDEDEWLPRYDVASRPTSGNLATDVAPVSPSAKTAAMERAMLSLASASKDLASQAPSLQLPVPIADASPRPTDDIAGSSANGGRIDPTSSATAANTPGAIRAAMQAASAKATSYLRQARNILASPTTQSRIAAPLASTTPLVSPPKVSFKREPQTPQLYPTLSAVDRQTSRPAAMQLPAQVRIQQQQQQQQQHSHQQQAARGPVSASTTFSSRIATRSPQKSPERSATLVKAEPVSPRRSPRRSPSKKVAHAMQNVAARLNLQQRNPASLASRSAVAASAVAVAPPAELSLGVENPALPDRGPSAEHRMEIVDETAAIMPPPPTSARLTAGLGPSIASNDGAAQPASRPVSPKRVSKTIPKTLLLPKAKPVSIRVATASQREIDLAEKRKQQQTHQQMQLQGAAAEPSVPSSVAQVAPNISARAPPLATQVAASSRSASESSHSESALSRSVNGGGPGMMRRNAPSGHIKALAAATQAKEKEAREQERREQAKRDLERRRQENARKAQEEEEARRRAEPQGQQQHHPHLQGQQNEESKKRKVDATSTTNRLASAVKKPFLKAMATKGPGVTSKVTGAAASSSAASHKRNLQDVDELDALPSSSAAAAARLTVMDAKRRRTQDCDGSNTTSTMPGKATAPLLDTIKYSSETIRFGAGVTAPSSTAAAIKLEEVAVQNATKPLPPSEAIELPEIDTDYESSSDEDDLAPAGAAGAARKKRNDGFSMPGWAESPELRQTLRRQQRIDPDDVFGPLAPLQMEEIFKGNKDRNATRFRPRSSSANWAQNGDKLTGEEIAEYARTMGYK